MRVLLTGASSFTGFWFAKALLEANVEVIAPLRGALDSYQGVRAERIRLLSRWAKVAPECAFGGEAFLALIGSLDIDVLCHHAAEARDYKAADFDVLGAVASNTHRMAAVLQKARERGLKAVVATGSVFEPDEGVGPAPRRAFSPYGLSKGLTWATIRQHAEALDAPVHKFVIANPFGPFEEPRFVNHVVDRWGKGETAVVKTPDYLRDNIHVDLLSLTYARYVVAAAEGRAASHFGPCGYLETQGAFAQRLARELGGRLGVEARVELRRQTDFSEPRARINRDAIDPADYGWNEDEAWDALAEYYRARGVGPRTAPVKTAPVELLGAIDSADHLAVTGWLTAKGGANPRYVRVFVDDVELGALRADRPRPDLAAAQVSDGLSGFRFPFVQMLDPFADHVLRLEDRDTGRMFGPPPRVLPSLVSRPDAPFVSGGDFVAVNVGAAQYKDDRVEILLEAFGAAAGFGPPKSDNAKLEVLESKPVRHRYLEKLGIEVARLRLAARPIDPALNIDIRFDEAEKLAPADRLVCRNLVPARVPDYARFAAKENMERVSGPGEDVGRFVAGGLATAYRIDELVKLYFGRGLGHCGAVLDWGAGAGRVAAPLARIVAPGLKLTATDVDSYNVSYGKTHFPDITFVDAPFLPKLPFADASFGAVYGVSVFTHLTESVQFAWLRELRRIVPAGAPVVVSVHSEFCLFREAAGRPDILTEALRRGISDSVNDGNLGPKLAEKNYYRATFHTRRYILDKWSQDFEVVQILTAANGNTQDFVVLRAK